MRSARGSRPATWSSTSAAATGHSLPAFADAAAGLIGAIDHERTGRGVIVCLDGFAATTVDEAGFRSLTDGLGIECEMNEVDDSSLFCVLTKPGERER